MKNTVIMIKIKREAKVGFFAVLMIAALYWGINYLSGQDIFRRNNTYFAMYDQVNGIQKSSAIVIRGFKVGVISDISFDPEKSDKIVLHFSIRSKYRIPDNSQARIFSDGLMGGKAVEIVLGDSERYLQDGDTLHSVADKGFLELAGSELEFIKNKADLLVDNISTTLESINKVFAENSANINTTVANLAQMSASLNDVISGEKDNLRAIVENINALSATLKNNTQKIDNIVTNVEDFTGSLNEIDFASVVSTLSSSLEQLDATLTKINNSEGTLGRLVNDEALYNSLAEASLNLSELLDDMRERPSRYVNFSLFGKRDR